MHLIIVIIVTVYVNNILHLLCFVARKSTIINKNRIKNHEMKSVKEIFNGEKNGIYKLRFPLVKELTRRAT